MIPSQLLPLANHLWQTTLFAGAAGLLTLPLRKNRAYVRYWLWIVASVKFLIPFSVLMDVGGLLRRHTAAVPSAPIATGLSFAIEQVSEPFTSTARDVAIPGAHWSYTGVIVPVLVALWAIGFAWLVLRWAFHWRRVRASVRTASSLNLPIAWPVKTSSEFGEPGVFGVVRPVLLLPDGILECLAPPELDAIVAHELCHIRHRDNLVTAIHMAVESLFWFHPLVWWVGARLIDERERACDEEVLQTGGDPQAYAEGILKICESYLASPLPCIAGVTGANLKRRIEAIMTNRVAARLTLWRSLLLVLAATGSVAGPVLVGVLNAPSAKAQTQSSLPEFDVASIKPFKPGSAPENRKLTASHGSMTIQQENLRSVIAWAYGVKMERIKGPGWLDSEEYDIEARAAESASQDRLKLMLQALLAQRFKMALHRMTEQLPVYALIVGKGGSRLHAVDRDPSAGGKFGLDGGFFHKEMVTNMPQLADQLPMFLDGTPVLDRTGLTGVYEFTLKVEMDLETFRSKMPEIGQVFYGFGMVPSVFQSVKELGLELVSEKGPVDILVIDHIQKPEPN